MDTSGPRPLTPGELFGRQLRAERNRRGITLSELATDLAGIGIGLDRTALGRLERSDQTPPGRRGAKAVTAEEVLGIAYVLGVSPLTLLAPAPGEDVRVRLHTAVHDGDDFRAWLRGDVPALHLVWKQLQPALKQLELAMAARLRISIPEDLRRQFQDWVQEQESAGRDPAEEWAKGMYHRGEEGGPGDGISRETT